MPGDRRPVTTQRRPVRRRWVRLAALLAAAGLAAYSPWLWIRSTSSGQLFTLADAPSADVTLVLGAGLYSDARPTPFLAARLDLAKALLDSGRTKVLLVSGDNRTDDYDEPTAMYDYLIAHGVPASRIVRDFAGRDTYDSCVRAQKIFGVNRLLVVSQGYHVPRAVATCRAIGLDAAGVGDWSMTEREAWQTGQIRERLAAWKSIWDLLSRRDPVLGPPESGVADALAGAR